MESPSPPKFRPRKRRAIIICAAFLSIGLSPAFVPLQAIHRVHVTPIIIFADRERQQQQQEQYCRNVLNESIQPWAPQNAYQSIVERYLPCATNVNDPRISRAGSNFQLWKQHTGRFKNCSLASSNELIPPSYVNITIDTEGRASGGITDMHWLLLTHYSALKVANYAGFCNATQSAMPSSGRPFLVACNSDKSIDKCIRNGIDAASDDAQITVFMLEDLPRPTFDQMRLLTSDDRLVNIYATNPSQVHPKLQPYPIGLHSAQLWLPHLDGREAQTEQRTNLLECGGITLWLSGGVVSKKGLAATPQGGNGAGNRRDKLRLLRQNGFKCGKKMRPDEYIESMMRAKFVFSPRGHGQQNYREWEALAAGAIPLIDAPPPTHASLYEGLPLVAVSDWSTITPDYLEKTWDDMQRRAKNGEYDMRKAYFFPYWLDKLMQI